MRRPVALVVVGLLLAGCTQDAPEAEREPTPPEPTAAPPAPVVNATGDVSSVLLPTVNCHEAVVLTFVSKADIRAALAVPDNVILMSAGDFLGRTGLAPQAPPSGTPADDVGAIASGNMACDDGSLYHAIVTPIESLRHADVPAVPDATVQFYSDARALALAGPRLAWFSLAGVAAMSLNGSTHALAVGPLGESATMDVVAEGSPILAAELEGGEADPSFGFPIRAWLQMPDGSTAIYDLERSPATLYNAFIKACTTSGYPEAAFGQCDPPTVGAIMVAFDETVHLQRYNLIPFADLA